MKDEYKNRLTRITGCLGIGRVFRSTRVLGLDRRRKFRVRLLPQFLGDRERLDLEPFPPGQFIARLMQLSVMTAAERDREFIADFHPDPPWLSKAQMMRIARLPPAD